MADGAEDVPHHRPWQVRKAGSAFMRAMFHRRNLRLSAAPAQRERNTNAIATEVQNWYDLRSC
jgi:hypothetical protein